MFNLRSYLRSYQQTVFDDTSSGILVLLWARQIGKTHTLAAWALHRLMTRPGRTVTIISNSERNGREFIYRITDFCRQIQESDPTFRFKVTRNEVRLIDENNSGRILVLAPNPLTARGFSGDLILDEFAFHKDADALWDAVEPILSSNPDFLCRIASTPNGKNNLFYRMVQEKHFPVSLIRRSDAYAMGVPIYDPYARQPITPDEARNAALDKVSYDRNYECQFTDSEPPILSEEIVRQADSSPNGRIEETAWSGDTLQHLRDISRHGECLYAGMDVGRTQDLSVLTVGQMQDSDCVIQAILRMQNLSFTEQKQQLAEILKLPFFGGIALDTTGLGVGLYDFITKTFGNQKIKAVNFASKVPIDRMDSMNSGRLILPQNRNKIPGLKMVQNRSPTVGIKEALGINMLKHYEDKKIKHPLDELLLTDLTLPRWGYTHSGKPIITTPRDLSSENGHADHFWSFALLLEAIRLFHSGKNHSNRENAEIGWQCLQPQRQRKITYF